MARALRVQYPGAWYHVANRGAGRQRVFRNDSHRQEMLDLLGELECGYGVEVHAYCLMSNRYDLIVRTQVANLSQAMRHLNGVYTQRYNRSTARDGPLFRGRYKAILFEPETCLLPVSRHLHRRPLVTGTVPRLDRYRWSSYPSYVTRRKHPVWLRQDVLEEHLTRLDDAEPTARHYRRYVEREGQTSDLVRDFYRAIRPGSILGPQNFRARILSEYGATDAEVPKRQQLPNAVPVEQILRAVGDYYDVPRREILTSVRGRLNVPRLAAIWLVRSRAHLPLAELASQFGMASYGSASAVLNRIKTQRRPAFWRQVKAIEVGLDGQSAGS
ncbi:MAG: transposase [Xanthomonadales bacterium]|nr:transposase [Xanthomonadales bacterium]